MCFIGFMFFYSLNFAFAAASFLFATTSDFFATHRFYLLHFARSSVICTLPCLSVFVKLCLPRLGQTTELCTPHQKSVGCGQMASCSTEMDAVRIEVNCAAICPEPRRDRRRVANKNERQQKIKRKKKTTLPKSLNPHRWPLLSQIASARWRAVWDGLFHRPAALFPPASAAFPRWDGSAFSERESPSICV